jgi:hypothetical protein
MSMASASGEAIRTRTRMESKNVCDQHLEAGDRTVSPAFRCLCRTKVVQGPGDWLAGFNAGLRGDAYIYPPGVQNRLTWRDVKTKILRVIGELEVIELQQDVIFASPRDVYIDLDMAIHQLESCMTKMRSAWWP